MIEFYKLMFDLALYYELFGYYFKIIFRTVPCVGGFLLLVSSVLLDVFLQSRDAKNGFWKWLPLILPVAVFCYRPTIWQIIQFIPIWIFIGYSIYYNRVYVNYDDFKAHYAFAGKLQFIMLPGIAGWARFPGGLLVAAPYLIMMLVMGVCLLRMLREKEINGKRQAILVGVFLVLSAVLTVGHAPQLILKGLGFVYTKAVAPVLMAVAMAVASIAYVFVIALRWMLTKVGKGPAPGSQEGPPAWYDATPTYEITPVNAEWLKYVLIVIVSLLAAGVVFLILRRMLADRHAEEDPLAFDEKTEQAVEKRTPKPRGIFGMRPRNPRLAVRYYFSKFLAECEKRDPEMPTGLTATELAQYCTELFPGADPALLSALYAPARYSTREPVSQEDADHAAAAWRELKHTKLEKKSD